MWNAVAVHTIQAAVQKLHSPAALHATTRSLGFLAQNMEIHMEILKFGSKDQVIPLKLVIAQSP